MEDVKIIHKDRGVTFSRIEKILQILMKNRDNLSHKLWNLTRNDDKKITKELYNQFDLSDAANKISEIDSKIKELKDQRKIYEDQIREKTQGPEGSSNRYGDCETIRKGSEIHTYLSQDSEKAKEMSAKLEILYDNIEKELWLAPDIETVNTLVSAFEKERNEIATEISKMIGE